MLLGRVLSAHSGARLLIRQRATRVLGQMPKRKIQTAEAVSNGKSEHTEEASVDGSEAGEAPNQAPKKRKPTKKQLEEAEAAARPRYDESQRPPALEGPALRVVTWNVASLNSTLKKDPDAISKLVRSENADVICLQETKLQETAVEAMEARVGLPGWHYSWACSTTKKGYSGTAAICRQKPLSVQIGMGKASEHDEEGRVVTVELDSCFLVNVYTPNAGEGLKRLDYRVQSWDRTFAEFIQELQQSKPVVITGDLNCAHQNIDIHSPGTNKKTAGFTDEERESFGKNLEALDLVDCFRCLYPDTVGYTYWSIRSGARAKNKGWRLDYFLVSKQLVSRLHDCFILKSYEEEAKLSDHCPIGIVLKI